MSRGTNEKKVRNRPRRKEKGGRERERERESCSCKMKRLDCGLDIGDEIFEVGLDGDDVHGMPLGFGSLKGLKLR